MCETVAVSVNVGGKGEYLGSGPEQQARSEQREAKPNPNFLRQVLSFKELFENKK